MEDFFGRFTISLDAKGRINLPARFRETDGKGDLKFILTRGSEQNIVMFTVDEWRRKDRELDELNLDGVVRRRLRRRLNYHASLQKVDKQGRLNLPANLISYAKLEKEVALVGEGRKIEIWNPKLIEADLDQLEREFQKQADILDY